MLSKIMITLKDNLFKSLKPRLFYLHYMRMKYRFY